MRPEETWDYITNLEFENKRMGDFLELLGVDVEDITDVVINGDLAQVKALIERVKDDNG